MIPIDFSIVEQGLVPFIKLFKKKRSVGYCIQLENGTWVNLDPLEQNSSTWKLTFSLEENSAREIFSILHEEEKNGMRYLRGQFVLARLFFFKKKEIAWGYFSNFAPREDPEETLDELLERILNEE